MGKLSPSWKAVNAKLRKDRKTRKEHENEIAELKMCYEPVHVVRDYWHPVKLKAECIISHDFDFVPVEIEAEMARRQLMKEFSKNIQQYWKVSGYETMQGNKYVAELWVMEAEE